MVWLTPLHWAAAEGSRDEVRYYLSQGVNPNLTDNLFGETALHWAAKSGESGPIRALLEYGADPNAREGRGITPLILAVRQQQGELLAALSLIEGGADVRAADALGETALHIAALNHTNPAVSLLIRMLRAAGANPNAKAGEFAATPLHYAVISGNIDAIWALTGDDSPFPADVNMPDNRGLTPLHFACGAVVGSGDLVLVVRALLHEGANINARDPDGWTPLDYAVRSEQEQVEEELRARGAHRGKP